MRNLILITSQFPFGTGEPFLETELPVLTDSFERVIIIAQNVSLGRTRKIPEHVKLIRYDTRTSLGGFLLMPILIIRNLFPLSKLYKDEVRFRTKNLPPPGIRQKGFLFKKIVKALQLRDFILEILKNENITDNTVFYSYWLKTGAHAIAMLNVRNSIKISRAHGSDLYEEKTSFGYLPMLKFLSDNLDAIFFISENGKEYFKDKTGSSGSRLMLSRLGVNNLRFLSTETPKSDMFIMVSCSNILPLKRIDLIISALEKVDTAKELIWIHFGDGFLRKELEDLAKARLNQKSNVKYSFMGYRPNHEILEYYRQNRINLFINTSSTEGIPVSIMEAQSFGIPVIATDVGGVREIVAKGTGILLPDNFEISELTHTIEFFLCLSDEDEKIFRDNAFRNWKNYFNASTNYKDFITKLNSILASSIQQ